MYPPIFAMKNNHMWDTIKIKNDKCKLLSVVSFFPGGDTLVFFQEAGLQFANPSIQWERKVVLVAK
jgi:hypothetical protein